ncbi:MAG: NAD(P)H-dependent oxidoreductase [Bacteriovorax sp.]|nr:NAD(P)H-dependent oxidoreductase [Bacteriovorax sp.]
MRTLIILGHPDKKSFCSALADAYEAGAKEKGGDVQRINLIDLKFDPILRNGYRRIQELEPDLIEAQRLIKWANHLVFVFPVWWSAPPALMKGFIDRVFLPGFAFKYRENSSMWDKCLRGRSSRLIITSDAPVAWLYLAYFHPAVNMMKKAILEFCGISPVSITSFGSIKNANENKRKVLLDKSYRDGLQDN